LQTLPLSEGKEVKFIHSEKNILGISRMFWISVVAFPRAIFCAKRTQDCAQLQRTLAIFGDASSSSSSS
jgi:hypothetical protein